MTTIPERVALGAAWLDEHHPDWAYRIDLKRLNLTDCKACVLGQTFGDYWTTPLVKDPPYSRRAIDELAIPLGFQAENYARIDNRIEYRALAAEWTRVVLARRDAAILALETPVPDDGGEGQ